MNNERKFYTYAYLREDGTPYYIGKGTGKRVYDNYKRVVKCPKNKNRVLFLKKNITEEEAFRHEKYMIFVFGRKNIETGILHNKTNGGEGTSGYIHKNEDKITMSKCKKGKKLSYLHRKKLSDIRKGKKWWNNGEIEKKFYENPGEKWMPGRLKNEEVRIKYGKQNIGRKPTKETLEKFLKRNLKYNYTVKSPEGKIYTTNNMKKFALEHQLTPRLMTSVAVGKYKHHKGWTVVAVEELER